MTQLAWNTAKDAWSSFLSAPSVVDNSSQAMARYYFGDGSPAQLGPNTQQMLIESPRMQQAIRNISNGTSTPSGNFSVDMTGQVYHVGRTAVDYTTNCSGNRCVANFTAFKRDGFWDIFWGEDRVGPAGELAGKPYPYQPFEFQIEYPNPKR